MHQFRTRALLCDRSREWAALSVDAELSEFEQALLNAHLERCSACREFAADVRAIAAELRNAPLERPAIPVALPERRRAAGFRGFQVAAAAAAVVAAGVFGGILGLLPNSSSQSREAASPRVVNLDAQLRQLRRDSLRPPSDIGAFKPPIPLA